MRLHVCCQTGLENLRSFKAVSAGSDSHKLCITGASGSVGKARGLAAAYTEGWVPWTAVLNIGHGVQAIDCEMQKEMQRVSQD